MRKTSMKSILIVEDHTPIADVICQAISLETMYQTLVVADGFQALTMVEEIRPDLFLLNYNLPKMTGIELYDHLHVIERLEHVPAIMMSANPPIQELEQRKIITIKKPFGLSNVIDIIVSLLE